jgi:hypothetical protein
MIKIYFWLCISLIMVGCASTVKTYDVSGKMIGSCVSQASLLSKKMATCTGYSNQQGYTFVPVSVKQLKQEQSEQIKKSSLNEMPRIQPKNQLEDLPQNRKINLAKF